MPTGRSSNTAIILTLSALELVPFFAIRSVMPPSPVAATAPETAFSSARAAKHVAALAKEPHPPGTPAHRQVREYIVGELEKLGLAARVKQSRSIYVSIPPGQPVQNILARVPGSSGGRAILLSAHYDTCSPAAGAADDSAGVAAILETVRALRAGPPLKNDVIVLITDGEEQGLLGAMAFVTEDEWAGDVGLALNFDARGNSGPSIMFETSGGSVPLISEFARAAPHAVGNSLTGVVYQYLPNGTDFTYYKKAGMAGFNFAFIDGWRAYHSPLDTPENLCEASLQHHGSYALALTRHFGDKDLNMRGAEGSADAIYFNPWGGIILYYEKFWAMPLALLTAAVLMAIVVAGWRRGHLRLWSMIRGVVAALCCTVLISMVVTLAVKYLWPLVQMAIWSTHSPRGENLGSVLMTLSLWNLALALVALLYLSGPSKKKGSGTFVRSTLWAVPAKVPDPFFLEPLRTRAASVSLGYAALWLALCLITSFFVPAASFLFTWPLLFGLGGHAILVLHKPDEPLSRLKQFAVLLCAMPALILLTPALYLFVIGLAPLGAVGVFVPTLLSVLTLGLLLPLLQLTVCARGWALQAAAMGVAAGCFMGAMVAKRF